MAFTFKTKKRPNPLQSGLAHFTKGFIQGKTATLQQEFQLKKKNEATLKNMNNVVSQMWSQIEDPTMKNKVGSVRMAASMGNYTPKEYVLALSDTGIFNDEAYGSFADKFGIVRKKDTRPEVITTEIIDGREVKTTSKGRNGTPTSIIEKPIKKNTFKSKITNVSNGVQTVTEIYKDVNGNVVSERVISEKPVAGSITVINKTTNQKEKILLSNYLSDKDNYDIPKSSFEEFFNEFFTDEETTESIEENKDQKTMESALEFKIGRLGSPPLP